MAAVLPPIVNNPVAPVLTIQIALGICNFNANEIQSLVADAIPNWNAFLRMTEKDIHSMAEEYGKRTINDGRIVFGFHRKKELQGLMHWVQDTNRMSLDPEEQILTIEAIGRAIANSEIRKNLADNMDTASKAADPGKLKNNTDWYTWSQGFTNYLSTIPGTSGIPLSYIVREVDEPIDAEDTTDYLAMLVSRAPLTGVAFAADRRQVHQLLTGKLLGEQAEEWIRDDKTKQNGRIDFNNLRIHFEGEGNVSRRITQAENLYKTLYYKQERSMKFTIFLSRMQVMFQIYKQEGEEQPESAKIRFLLDRIQATHLQQVVTNLRFQSNQGNLTFTTAKNSLMTEIVKSTDYQQNDNRGVSSTYSSGNKKSNEKGTKTKGVFKKNTSSIKHPPKGDKHIDKATWFKLSKEQQFTIRKYRDDHGLPGGSIKKVSSVTTKSETISDKDVDRIVAAIELRKTNDASTISSNSSAGQAFGGKSEATKRRGT